MARRAKQTKAGVRESSAGVCTVVIDFITVDGDVFRARWARSLRMLKRGGALFKDVSSLCERQVYYVDAIRMQASETMLNSVSGVRRCERVSWQRVSCFSGAVG